MNVTGVTVYINISDNTFFSKFLNGLSNHQRIMNSDNCDKQYNSL